MDKYRLSYLEASVALASMALVKDAPFEVDMLVREELAPPRRLSIDPNSEDFHPSYVRVGLRIDGQEHNDVSFYDADRKEYMTIRKTSHLAGTIEPYWRYPESRQQRRARMRWEKKRGK